MKSRLLYSIACLLPLLETRGWVYRTRRADVASASSCNRGSNPKMLVVYGLSDKYLESDLVAVSRPGKSARLCAVKIDGAVAPLCIREDDVETDLFADPREYVDVFWNTGVCDDDVTAEFGEGFYGQRPVPSLGGGPGYGADADEVWSVSEEVLDTLRNAGVEIPVLDVGIAHGEKARGGFF